MTAIHIHLKDSFTNERGLFDTMYGPINRLLGLQVVYNQVI